MKKEILYTCTGNFEQVCVLLVHTLSFARIVTIWTWPECLVQEEQLNTLCKEYWAAIQKKELDLDVINDTEVGLLKVNKQKR